MVLVAPAQQLVGREWLAGLPALHAGALYPYGSICHLMSSASSLPGATLTLLAGVHAVTKGQTLEAELIWWATYQHKPHCFAAA